MSSFRIRRGLSSDIDTLAGFNLAMALETEDKTLDIATLRPGVAGIFEDERRGFYLIAEAGDDAPLVAGALMVTCEWSDWRNGNFWWVQSVYVRPEYRRQGAYSALYAEVRRLARARDDVCGLRLYVEKDNRSAQLTYANLGMAETAYLLFEEEF